MPDSIFEEMGPPGLSDVDWERRITRFVEFMSKDPVKPAFVWAEQPDGSSICDLGYFRVAQAQHASGGQYRAYDLIADSDGGMGSCIGVFARIDLAEAAAEARIRKYLED